MRDALQFWCGSDGGHDNDFVFLRRTAGMERSAGGTGGVFWKESLYSER